MAISRWTAAVPTVSDYFNWSSPAVANGKVYMGVASDCDNPFPPGGVDAFDQATGDRIATYYSVPGGGNGEESGRVRLFRTQVMYG